MAKIGRPSFIGAAVAFFFGCAQRVHSAPSSSTAEPYVTQAGMMQGGMMGGMMNLSTHDMSTYMDMFNHHSEIHRKVVRLPNGIRTTTESENPRISALLHEHVPSMYAHISSGEEVRCMSDSLPTMFRYASKYRRHLEMTATGVVVMETSDDQVVLAAIWRHADEVSGFVREGMPAMMRGMMQR